MALVSRSEITLLGREDVSDQLVSLAAQVFTLLLFSFTAALVASFHLIPLALDYKWLLVC